MDTERMKSTARRSIALGVLGSALAMTVQAAAPDVTGLRSDIYSASAVELFWDRVNGQALSYEILRDDGELAVTDGTSYTDLNRAPGVVTEYAVTAIDAEGMRSDTATISVGPFDQASLQVLRLRGDIYSATAAELFWLRVPERNVSYEIVRDDGATSVTRGNSFYDDTRTPGTTNTYTITVLDEQGVRQLPATLTLGPFGTESIISPPPVGARAVVYSGTAAELFWKTIAVPSRATRSLATAPFSTGATRSATSTPPSPRPRPTSTASPRSTPPDSARAPRRCACARSAARRRTDRRRRTGSARACTRRRRRRSSGRVRRRSGCATRCCATAHRSRSPTARASSTIRSRRARPTATRSSRSTGRGVARPRPT